MDFNDVPLRAASSLIHPTGSAKLMFCPSGTMNAVIPMSRPSVSNNPPPLEPEEMGAEVCDVLGALEFADAGNEAFADRQLEAFGRADGIDALPCPQSSGPGIGRGRGQPRYLELAQIAVEIGSAQDRDVLSD